MPVSPNRLTNTLAAVLATVLVLSVSPAPALGNATVKAPTALQTNSTTDPIGIETPPAFSWNPGVARQTAYQIQAGTRTGRFDLWDSGRVTSSTSIRVPFPKPVTSQTRYTWRVRVWDGSGRPSPWSSPAAWEMGLTGGESDWKQAAWIGGRSPEDHDWTNSRTSVTFRGDDPVHGLELLTRAEPIGKAWGESLSWSIRSNAVGAGRLTRAAAAGDNRVFVDNVTNWKTGDAVTVDRRGPASQRTTVTAVGTPTIDVPLAAPAAAGATSVTARGVTGLAAGEQITVNGQNVTVTAVQGGNTTTVSFTPELTAAATTAARLFRLGTGLTLADPLTADRPAGTPLVGAGHLQLVMKTNHYAGNTWVDGSGEPGWGVNYYDPQSQTNPTAVGTRSVPVATVDLPESTGLTFDTYDTRDHNIELDVNGVTVTALVNGTIVDTRMLTGDQIRRHGSIGFGSGSSATVREVTVRSPESRTFHADLRKGANPFESGIGGPGGLTFVAKNAMLPIANPAPLVRTRQTLPHGSIAAARLYVATGGFADLTINGRQITTDGRPARADGTNVPRMITDQAAYDRTVLYDTFDVTGLVKPGKTNVVAAELGRGWYGVTTPNEWYWNLAPYVGAPRMRARLVVSYADGRTAEIRTDRSWQTTDGPTTFDSVYSGEKYDARLAADLGDWRTGATTTPWQPATVMLEPGSCSAPAPGCHGRISDTARPAGFIPAKLRAAEAEPVQVIESLRPRSVTETAPGSGVYVADFGQILTGFPVLDLAGVRPASAGQTLRLRGGNSVTGDGSATSPLVVAEENNFHDANLQTGYYTLSGASRQTWRPDFNNWGFRYLEVRNAGAAPGRAPDRNMFRVDVARSGFARTGAFDTDNPLLDRINSNLEWSQQNNNVGKPTDTPSREKNGWTGDTMADSLTQSLIWDVEAAHQKYLRGFPDAQISTGQVPMILPAAKGGYGYDRTPGWNATWRAVPAWDSALFLIPWGTYQIYGATNLLRELYPTQEKLLQYYETLFTPENDYTFNASLGAYSGAESGGSNAVISLQMYIRFCDYMAQVGRMIGETGKATGYADKASTLRKAFVRKYWDPAAGYFTQGSVSSENSLAIAWNMVPGSDLDPADPLHLAGTGTQEANKTRLAKLLADRIVAAGYHIQNDMYGSRYEFGILDDYGYTDVALRAVTQTGAPGYVDQIAKGATSLWESWTGGSLNHHYRSNVATWFYQGLAGITPTAPAYASVRIRPHVPQVAVNAEVPTSPEDTALVTHTLDRARASIDTVRGTVASGWQRLADGRTRLTVTIPANTRAEVWVPTGGKRVTAPRGAAFTKNATSGGTAYAVYRVEQGTYRFN